MLVLTIIFFMLFLFSFTILLMNGILGLTYINLCFIISVFVTVITLRSGLLFNKHDFLFTQFNLYKMLFMNFLDDFFPSLSIILEFLIPYGKVSTVVDSMEIKKNNILENGVMCNIINMSFSTITALLDGNNIKIHSISDDYSRNAIAKLFDDIHTLYDDNLF